LELTLIFIQSEYSRNIATLSDGYDHHGLVIVGMWLIRKEKYIRKKQLIRLKEFGSKAVVLSKEHFGN
jgi:hypothetical protein